MGSGDEADPFLWDVDRVVKELCTGDGVWGALPAFKRPNLEALASNILESEVDGESLLSYADVFGSLSPLMSDLGIRKVPHQLKFSKTIQLFHARSPAYRNWKKGYLASLKNEDANEQPQPQLADAPELASPLIPPPKSPETSRVEDTAITEGPPFPAHLPQTDASKSFPAAGQSSSSGPSIAGPSECEEPPKKKKRIAPTNINSSTLDASGPRFVPTEADIFARPSALPLSSPFDDGGPDPPTAYLGSHRLTLPEIIDPDLSAELDGHRPFSWFGARKPPPGRQLQVNRALKRYLNPTRRITAGRGSSSEKDNILPLFGESDDEYDSDTIREMEKEEEERAKAAAQGKKMLSEAEVNEAIERGLQALADSWAETKKPTWDRKARRLWDRHRRSNTRRGVIAKSIHRLRQLDARVVAICNEIRSNQWRSQDELQRQMASLQTTVFDREHERWLVATLNSPVKPNRVQMPRKQDLPSKLPSPKTSAASDEEVLTSSDDEDSSGSDINDDHNREMDNFIVDDDQPMDLDSPSDSDPMETDGTPGSPRSFHSATSSRPFKQSTPAGVSPASSSGFDYDLTQFGSPAPATETDGPQRNPPETQDHHSADLPTAPSAEGGYRIPDAVLSMDDLDTIASIDLEHWERANDPERLVIAVICRWDPSLRASMLEIVMKDEPDRVWERVILRAIDKKNLEAGPAEPETLQAPADRHTHGGTTDQVAFMLAKLFDAYVSCSSSRIWETRQLRKPTVARIVSNRATFDPFCQLLRRVGPKLADSPALEASAEASLPVNGTLPDQERPEGDEEKSEGKEESGEKEKGEENGGEKAQEENGEVEIGRDNAEEGNVDEDDIGAVSSSDDDALPVSPANRRRRRKIVRDKDAEAIRENTKRNAEEYAERRQLVWEKVATTGSVPDVKTRLIINDAKADDQGFVYVHDHIASRIKPHQIEGVRFMWNQLISQSDPRQGCLLAHTMGLGKTMQVITLLVAIAEAARSADPSISSQVPNSLRESKTLVLCPAGLADNWVEELCLWTPFVSPSQSLLGAFSQVSASLSERVRHAKVRDWASDGGVLVIGYTLYAKLYKVQETARRLREAPNIVVADEAHYLKNPKSDIHMATADFRTKSRIAMTGSPLANHVLDYFAMIDWVAPNYLSSESEFKAVYGNPINQGLYADSTASDKRQAIKMLNILKELVAPKVHRMGIAALKSDLPPKKEFIIYLRLTDVQRIAYEAYVDHVNASDRMEGIMSMSRVWSFVGMLSNLLAHPFVFRETLKKRKKALAAAREDSVLTTTTSTSKSTPDTGDEDNVDLPQAVLSDLLATVTSPSIDMNPALSWKVVLLMRIVEESKRAGDKLLVFSQRIPTLDFLQHILRLKRHKVARLDGGTPVPDRQASIKNFNSDGGAEVYLISTKAGGVGLNMHGANRVVIFDFKYVPTDEQQAVGRAYRMTQEKPVFVYWLIVGGSFEEKIQNRSVFKSQLASRLVDKKQPIAWSKRKGDYFAKPRTPPKSKDLPDFLGKDSILDSLLKSEDLADGIRSIIMTETFEEEEPDDDILTNEDRKEMSDMVAQNRRRALDPAAYGPPMTIARPVMAAGPLVSRSPISYPPTAAGAAAAAAAAAVSQASANDQQPQPGLLARESQPPQQPARLAAASLGGDSRKTGLTIKIKVPEHMRQSSSRAPAHLSPHPPPLLPPSFPTPHGHPAPPGSGANIAGLSLPHLRGQAEGNSPTQPVSAGTSLHNGSSESQQHNAQPTAALEPVAGVGTHLRSPEITNPDAAAHKVFVASLESKKAELSNLLEATRVQTHARGYVSRTAPSQIMAQMQETIDKAPESLKGVALLDHWTSIQKAVAKPKLAEAIISGHLKPRDLAAFNRIEREEVAAQFDKMPEATFREIVWNSMEQERPNSVTQPYASASTVSPSEADVKPSTHHRIRSGSSTALGRRPARLPSWAQRELSREKTRGQESPARPPPPQPPPPPPPPPPLRTPSRPPPTPSRPPRPGDTPDTPHVID